MASKNTLPENALLETKSSRLMPSNEGRISKKLINKDGSRSVYGEVNSLEESVL